MNFVDLKQFLVYNTKVSDFERSDYIYEKRKTVKPIGFYTP